MSHINQAAGQLHAPWPDLDRHWESALDYLQNITDKPVSRKQPTAESLLAALENPELELSYDTAPAVTVMQVPQVLPPSQDEAEILKIKLQALESRVEKSKNLVSHIAVLEKNLERSTAQITELQKSLTDAEVQLESQAKEISRLKLAEIPVSLDAVSIQERTRALEATIAYLHQSHKVHVDFAPLTTEPQRLKSALAGHPISRGLWQAVDQFTVAPVNPHTWRPRSQMPAWIAVNQSSTLAKLGELIIYGP